MALAFSAVTVVVPIAAHAEEICVPQADGTVECHVENPPAPPASPDPSTATPGATGCATSNGVTVPCVVNGSYWFSSHQCWATVVTSAYPLSSEYWQGHVDGSLWSCTFVWNGTAPAPVLGTPPWWIPPGSGPDGVPDPGTLAQSAVGSLGLKTANVRLAPQYPAQEIVGVPMWMWVPGEQWQTLSKTVSTALTAVTVTAQPDRVAWDMGPDTVNCYTAGRVWADGMGDDEVSPCRYAYKKTSKFQPGGVFEVTATIKYQVDWTCTGVCTQASGTLGIVDAPSGVGQVQVVQRQTVVVR
jgi:hypothetical protein